MDNIWAGADVNLANDGGRIALHYAASKGWLKVAEILISHGSKLNRKDKVCEISTLILGLSLYDVRYASILHYFITSIDNVNAV